jgi:murein L,D-transpeptidase YcbB/YkuD
LVFLLLIISCEQKETVIDEKPVEKLVFRSQDFQIKLADLLFEETIPSGNKDFSIFYLDTLKHFYIKHNFTPAFLKNFEMKGLIDSLLVIIGSAGDHGLNPEFYHFKEISEEFNKSDVDTLDASVRYDHIANADLLISDAVLRYSYHIRYGLVNPKSLFPDSYFLPVVDSLKRNLLEPLSQKNIIKYLHDIQPKSKKYKNLQIALNNFKGYNKSEWNIIPYKEKKIEPGDRDSSLVTIINRLNILGFIDTAKLKIENFTFYDSVLVNPIKKFQSLNGLNSDGIIGKNTIEKLNTTPEDYINKIKLSLERFRWLDYTDTSEYILVNIPDFRLYIVDDGEEIFNTKVCTGRKRPSNYQKQVEKFKESGDWKDKPEDWETPVLYGNISYVVLNPTWSVPESIIKEEIFQKVSEDSTYLLNHNFKIYLDTLEIHPLELQVSDLSTEEVEYKIIQDPWAGNALGRIKFMFPNRFGVYLHDTPSRTPFNYSNRAVSHGCVRVEKPLTLAEFLLKDHPKWNIDFLKIEIGNKVEDKEKIAEYKKQRSKLRKVTEEEKTTELFLSQKVPLFIDYYTAWVDADGEVNFRDDVYNKDKVLLEYLEAKKLI